jgi:hypothetical protein
MVQATSAREAQLLLVLKSVHNSNYVWINDLDFKMKQGTHIVFISK